MLLLQCIHKNKPNGFGTRWMIIMINREKKIVMASVHQLFWLNGWSFSSQAHMSVPSVPALFPFCFLWNFWNIARPNSWLIFFRCGGGGRGGWRGKGAGRGEARAIGCEKCAPYHPTINYIFFRDPIIKVILRVTRNIYALTIKRWPRHPQFYHYH